MSMRTELVEAVGERYRSADRGSKGRVLDEFVAVTGFHRKHAMRLLQAKRPPGAECPRRDRRIYGEAVRTALVVLWEASDRLCGKRLRPLIPILLEAMERHGHVDMAPEVKQKLAAMSAATIDRALQDVKTAGTAHRRRGAPSSALKKSVPIRTFGDWDDPAPGHLEADLVSHSGPVAKGSFAWTFTLTDIATGWTECAPLLVREQTVLVAVLDELRKLMPFVLLGFDTDNDSVFINQTVRDYCAASNITFTRCRPYRKNDQAWVEQKNGSVVGRLVGYRRFEGLEATAALADLYAAARLFVNFFQPSFKLAGKVREGARVHKRYHAPATPCQRLLDDPRTDDATRSRLRKTFENLDPVRLLRDMRAAQRRLVALADAGSIAEAGAEAAPSLDAFLADLRIAWQDPGTRPTATDKPRALRGRRRPDPLAEESDQLKRWFKEEPWRTSRELLEKLQAQQPGAYPDGLLRTLQRRVKIWRSEQARALVFTGSSVAPGADYPEMAPEKVAN